MDSSVARSLRGTLSPLVAYPEGRSRAPYGVIAALPFLPRLRVTLKAARTLGFPVVTVGDHIKRRRLEVGLYQREFAKLLGACHKTIIDWETGDTDVPMRAYPTVLAFLGYAPIRSPNIR